MEPDRRHAACVICGELVEIESGSATLTTQSEKHPERIYGFWVHPACLKAVAKPGFVGLSDL